MANGTQRRPATNGAKTAAAAISAQAKALDDTLNQCLGEMPTQTSVLEEAHIAVNGHRAENYGDQLTNFTNIADRMTITLRDKLVEPITPQDVALLMMDVKIARLAKTRGRHRDSIVDIAGYAQCLDVVNQAS